MTLRSGNTKVGALNHIGIAVANLAESLKQYQELFDSPDPSHILEDHDRGIRGAFIEQGETHIELLEPLRADSVIGKFIDNHGEGIHHMAFTVNDVDAKVEELKALGIPILDGPRPGLRGRIAFVHPKTVHGVLVELVLPPHDE